MLSNGEISEDAQDVIVKSVNDYLTKVKSGTMTESQIAEYQKNVVEPMKFLYLEQCAQVAGRYGGKKFLGLIPTGRKKVDGYLEMINSNLVQADKYIEEARKVAEAEQAKNEPVKTSPEVTKEETKEVKNTPKSFKEMLGSMINSNEEIDLKSGLSINTAPEKINWNRKYLPNNTKNDQNMTR